MDCKEIKINKITERLVIQSPGNFPPTLKENLEKSVNFKWFIAGIWDWLVGVGTVKGLMHAYVCVFFVVLGSHPRPWSRWVRAHHRRSSLAFMFEALNFISKKMEGLHIEVGSEENQVYLQKCSRFKGGL